MGDLDGVLGTLLIGSWGSTILFTLEFTWAVRYYRHASSQDGLHFKALIAVAIALDLAGLIGAQAYIYQFCASHWGDIEFLEHQHWPVTLCVSTESVTTVIVQGFLTSRYIRFSKNWYVGSALIVFVLVTLGFGLASATVLAIWNGFDQRILLRAPLTSWIITDVVANVCISIALIFEFYGKRTGLKTTDTMIRRLIIICIQSAIIPAFCSIIALVAYLVTPKNDVAAMSMELLPRFYILTLLYTLNVRQSILEESRVGRNCTIGGIHVVRTTLV